MIAVLWCCDQKHESYISLKSASNGGISLFIQGMVTRKTNHKVSLSHWMHQSVALRLCTIEKVLPESLFEALEASCLSRLVQEPFLHDLHPFHAGKVWYVPDFWLLLPPVNTKVESAFDFLLQKKKTLQERLVYSPVRIKYLHNVEKQQGNNSAQTARVSLPAPQLLLPFQALRRTGCVMRCVLFKCRTSPGKPAHPV